MFFAETPVGVNRSGSEIQDEFGASRSGAARGELVCASLFLGGKEHVAMVGCAGQYSRETGTTDSLFAGRRDGDAMRGKCRDYRLVCCNSNDLAR